MTVNEFAKEVHENAVAHGWWETARSFPEVAAAFRTPGVVDGELLVKGDFQGGEAASFNALQQRLGRKVVSAKMLADYPAFVRLYDILFDGEEDLRALPWSERRVRLDLWLQCQAPCGVAARILQQQRNRAGSRQLRQR